MAKTIQIRNVPDALYRKLKRRAASNGMSLSEYLMAELREFADTPTMREWQEKLEKLEPVELPISAADLVRAERDSR